MNRIFYLLLSTLIVLSVTGLVLETGHTYVCQREIDRLQAEFEKAVKGYPSQIAVGKAMGGYDGAAWLLAIPAGHSCKLSVYRQVENESTATRVRELRIPASNVAEVVAVQVGVGVDGTGQESLTIETTRSTKLSLPLAKGESLQGSESTFKSTIKYPVDLFDAKLRTYGYSGLRAELVAQQHPLDDEELLMISIGMKRPGLEQIIYGITLSDEP